jgi:hypothetical protein
MTETINVFLCALILINHFVSGSAKGEGINPKKLPSCKRKLPPNFQITRANFQITKKISKFPNSVSPRERRGVPGTALPVPAHSGPVRLRVLVKSSW